MESIRPKPFDLIFQGAHVIDPSQDLNGIADVGVRENRIAAVGAGLDPAGCPDIRDASGTYVCPGLIDLHGHWYENGLYGINAEIGLNHGVTTAVDAGTAGFSNFPDFRRTAIQTSRARILAFVHVSFMGLHAPFAEELLDLRYARPEETAMILDQNRDVTAGVKVRIGSMTGTHGDRAFDLALEAAQAARTPLMTHISAGANEPYILDRLRPGDILTHCFHGRGNGMVAETAEGFVPQLRLARERGVIFDIGHGCGSFSWQTAQRAFEHHFFPDTISSDLHRYSIAPPWSVTLPQVMSKHLCLGMSLYDVVSKTTVAPARALRREEELGSLRPGRTADLCQFRVVEGDYTFADSDGKIRRGNRMIQTILVVRAGTIHKAGDVPIELRALYPCDRPIFEPQA